MSIGSGGAPRFSIGGIIRASLTIVFGNFLRFVAVLLLIFVPVLAVLLVGGMLLAQSVGTENGGLQLNLAASQAVLPVIAILVMISAFFLVQASIVHGALQAQRGRPAAVFGAIAHGLALLPRLFVAGLLFAAAIGLIFALPIWMTQQAMATLAAPTSEVPNGLLLLVVALAALALLFAVLVLSWVFVPAIVVERAGPIACFVRSIDLTRGHRWKILGVLVLLFAANWTGSLIGKGAAFAGAPVAGQVIDLAVSAFFTMLSAVLSAVGYSELRAEKDGVPVEDVAKVFD